MSDWYLANAAHQEGPFDTSEMVRRWEEGSLQADHFVWREGMEDWQPASNIVEISGAAPSQSATSEPIFLSYATPLSLEVPDVNPLVPIEPDDGPFLKLGGQFNSGSGAWIGPVIASPRAFYFVKKSPDSQSGGWGGGLLGGVVGALVEAAIDSRKVDDTRTCGVAELPPAVRRFVLKFGNHLKHDAIVVAKETVNRVAVPAINNLITIHADGVRLTIVTGLFRNRNIRGWLTRNGWRINIIVGTRATSPGFGPGFGRVTPLQPKKTHPLMRSLYLLLAIAIVCLFIWLRISS